MRSDALAQLPPWNRSQYYATIKETTFAAQVGSSVQVCSPNAYRVALTFGTVTAGGCQLSTISTVTANNGGFILSGTYPLITLDYDTYGPLVQVSWFIGPGNGKCTIWETIMVSWPGDPTSGAPGVIEDTDNGLYKGRFVRPTNRGSPTAVYGNRWGKRQAQAPYGLPDFGNPGLP